MNKMLLAMVVLFGFCAPASSQAPYKVYTSPKLPRRDALERMNLTLAWNARVSVGGNRDGIASIQVLPGKRAQLAVQTFKGAVYLYDGDNGDLIWKSNTVGVPYWTSQPAGYNSQSLFVTRRNVLHVLNRFDGTQRVFTYDAASKLMTFGYELAFTPNAAPVADEDFLYVPMGNRVDAIYLPDFEAIARVKRDRAKLKGDGKKEAAKDDKVMLAEDEIPDSPDSPQPVLFWSYRVGNELTSSSPLIYGEQLSILTVDGALTSINRYEKGKREEFFEFKTTGKVHSAAGQHLHMAYLASDDFNLYAVSMNGGALVWRYVGGAPILQAPQVNDTDVYIAPERVGLRRIDRLKGREVWTNRDASRFLAANRSYVYAQDSIGKFFVLDARRGTTLAKLDLADWAIPVANEWTDRVYLAAQDGQILCLRHRDLTKALIMKTMDVPPPKEEKKPVEEKKKDEDKDQDKDKDKEKAAVEIERPQVQVALFLRGATVEAELDDRRTWAGR